MNKLSDFCEDRRHFRPQSNAARERSRVKTLRSAFLDLQRSLPAVPPNTKLSKLDILVLATAYICHLTRTLESQESDFDQATTFQPKTLYETGHQKRLGKCGNGNRESTSIPYADLTLPHSSKHLTLASITGHAVRTRKLRLQRELEPAERFLMARTRSINQQSSHQICFTESVNNSIAVTSANHRFEGKRVCHGGQTFPQDHIMSGKISTEPSRPIYQGKVGILHPVKKWPMRSRLYDSILGNSVKTVARMTSSSSSSSSTNYNAASSTLNSSFNDSLSEISRQELMQ